MNLYRRLKNLWALSEWEPSSVEKERFGVAPAGTKFSMITKPPEKRMATVMEPDNHFLDDVPVVKE